MLSPTGKDAVLIVDLAKPRGRRSSPRCRWRTRSSGRRSISTSRRTAAIALVADSMTVVEDGDSCKMVPDRQAVRHRPQGQPAEAGQHADRSASSRPVCRSVRRATLALVANRADGTIRVLKIDGTEVTVIDTVPMGEGVSRRWSSRRTASTPWRLKSPDNKVALLDVDGDKVTYNKLDLPVGDFPYNVVVAPDGKLAMTADNGIGGSSDGNVDAVSVIDLEAHPHARASITSWCRRAGGSGDQPERQDRRGASVRSARTRTRRRSSIIRTARRRSCDRRQEGDDDEDDRGRRAAGGRRVHAGRPLHLCRQLSRTRISRS